MAYLPSHQELRDHPKTKRAARKAGVTVPAMIGHLHLLWWWALDHAPDGDLGKFDADDLADAAMWEADPETFVKALRDCGPGDSDGFLEDGGKLHDWDDYGGKYGQRVAAGRKAAAARWDKQADADPMPPHSDANADASGTQSAANTEKRREEKKNKTVAADADDRDETFEQFWQQYPRGPADKPGGDGPKKPAAQKWRRLSDDERAACLIAVKHYADSLKRPDAPNAAHAITWLNQERWEQWQEPGKPTLGKLGTGGVAS